MNKQKERFYAIHNMNFKYLFFKLYYMKKIANVLFVAGFIFAVQNTFGYSAVNISKLRLVCVNDTSVKKDNKIYTEKEIDVKPLFPGGQKKRMQFLFENIHYPEDALESYIKGTVEVSFVVETDGSLTDVKIIKSVYPSIDNETLRVISLMPKWIPGTKDGQKVRVLTFMQVKFLMAKAEDLPFY